jgi:TonB family protein
VITDTHPRPGIPLILLIAAGLATGFPRHGTVDTFDPGPVAAAMPVDSGNCRPLSEPKRLPEPSLVVDTAGLFAHLEAVAPVSPGDVAVSMLWSDHPEGYLLGELPHPPWHDIVLEQLLASLRPVAKHASLAMQVHLQVGPNRTIRLARSILCGPLAVEGQNVSPPFGVGRVKAFAPSPIPGYQPQRVRTRMLVDGSGAVTAVSILSSSGYPEIDQALMQSMKAQHYRPALLDGRPVAVWISDRGITLAP